MASNIDFLEQQLTAISHAIDYPPTPDLASGFWRRLESSPTPAPSAQNLRFAGLAAVAAVAAIALVVAVIAPARDAAADLFDRINIFEMDRSTEGLPTDITGEPSTLEQAQTALGARILQPGDPSLRLERVLLQNYGEVYVAVLFYQGDDTSFALFASNAFVGKGLPSGGDATAEQVDGLDGEAYWLTGRRIVQSLRSDGAVITGSERVTDANTLIWAQDEFMYRIEGDLDKDEAIAIAQSLR
jgi:hypothetical protein